MLFQKGFKRRLAQGLRRLRWMEWGSLNLEDVFCFQRTVLIAFVGGPLTLLPSSDRWLVDRSWSCLSLAWVYVGLNSGSYFDYVLRLLIRWNSEKATLTIKDESYHVLFSSWLGLCAIYNSQKLNIKKLLILMNKVHIYCISQSHSPPGSCPMYWSRWWWGVSKPKASIFRVS